MRISGISVLSVIFAFSMFVVSCSEKSSIHTENFNTAGVNDLPRCSLDAAEFKAGTLSVDGWAADQEDGVPVPRVMVYVDNKLVGKATLGIERPDVATHFKNSNWTRAGWQMRAALPLSKGKHTLFAVAYDKMEAFSKSVDKEFAVE